MVCNFVQKVVAKNIVKVINAEGNERKYEYSASGKVEKLTDFDGESVSMSYNELNEISCIKDKSNREIHRKYDIKWNLCEEEFPGGAVRKYIYDKESRLIKEENYDKAKEVISVILQNTQELFKMHLTELLYE